MSYDDGRLKNAVEETYRLQLNNLCKVYFESRLGAKDEPVWAQGALKRFNDGLTLIESARNDLLKQYVGRGDNGGETLR